LRITVKLGGSILEDSDIRTRLLSQVGTIAKEGHEVILVHGGGKSLNRRLSQMQIASRFVEGLRVTDAETLEVAVMVLSGEVNKRLVSELGCLGTRAIGICGADAAAVVLLAAQGEQEPGTARRLGVPDGDPPRDHILHHVVHDGGLGIHEDADALPVARDQIALDVSFRVPGEADAHTSSSSDLAPARLVHPVDDVVDDPGRGAPPRDR